MQNNILQLAHPWTRFGNYMIDRVIVYFIMVFFLSAQHTPSNDFNVLWIVVIDFFYLSFTEAFFKGKTFGKLLTGSRVVNEDGSPITFTTAILRSLSRLAPFEMLSALGSPSYPWHDRWTRTYVVKENKSEIR